jgi:hypothetical protein
MIFSITPHLGAGTLRFGMSRLAIRAQLAQTPHPFLRADVEDTDFYAELGLFVLYDEAERCVALEFTRPARVLLGDVSLLALSKKKAVALLGADPAFELDTASYTCYEVGIGAYYEVARRAESVIAFAPNYYEKSQQQKRTLETLDLEQLSLDELWDFIKKG